MSDNNPDLRSPSGIHSGVPKTSILEQTEDQFILEWGRMSSSWGINRTMAQIHALLFVAGEPLDMDDIMDRLQISRGNASMNLRELMDWGIVRRFRRPGDRKDMYYSEADPYQMFARIIRERKRRELDPTADAIREVMTRLRAANDGVSKAKVDALKTRLEGLLEIFEVIDSVYKMVFSQYETTQDLRDVLKAAKNVKIDQLTAPEDSA